ncbi:hypothetical protein [Streptomyces minutiscleroticus]|uniref:hypothetical protein n=1 Tax=Streptomyces minutiscleroticus TaxID=68238 RepID=UPI00331CD39B
MTARPAAWVLLLASLFGCLQLANVTGRDTPDSRNYLSYALSLGGADKAEAVDRTVAYLCASRGDLASRGHSVDVGGFRGPDPGPEVREECRAHYGRILHERLREGRTAGHTAPFMGERFMRIFEVRPGYPVLLVPFVSLLGTVWGLWAAGVCVAAGGGVLVYLVLRTLRVPVVPALVGQVLYYVLPTGVTAMRPMTEGTMTALTLTALWGCALVLCGRREDGRGAGRRAGVWLVAGSLALLFAVKHSQALFLGGCLAVAFGAVAWRRRRSGRPAGEGVAAVAAVTAGAAVCTVVAARLLGYPSEHDSLQDLLTDHFARPDRADPWGEFWRLEAGFWAEWLRRQLLQPLFPALLAAGAWGALRQRPAFGAALVAAAATGVISQAAHPDIAVDRLLVMAWLLPVLGVPLLLARYAGPRVRLPGQSGGPLERTPRAARPVE